MVRLRQLIDRFQHRLLYIPAAFVVGAMVLSQLVLTVDRRLDDGDLPRVFETTVGSGRTILSAIAGGLISSITLLLSLMLVAVQLAGSQFSPRTLRDWIGDRTQQITIGVVLGTTVYCLLVLRETRSFEEGDALTPHLAVILAVLLGIASLVAVVRSVDHLTDSLRIGSVAGRIMNDTIGLIDSEVPLGASEDPTVAPASRTFLTEPSPDPPGDAFAVPAPIAGWVQQVDEDELLAAMPEGSTAYVAVSLGAFMLPQSPLVWIHPPPDRDDPCIEKIQRSVALGDSRTMQQDIGFGLLQMVDIALRALSPGVNDPNTANDIIAHLGVVILKLWERDLAPTRRSEDGRTIVRNSLGHGDYLRAAFDQIRHYGASDPDVSATMLRTLTNLRNEVTRRGLPGPTDPIDDIIQEIVDAMWSSDMAAADKRRIIALVPDSIATTDGAAERTEPPQEPGPEALATS